MLHSNSFRASRNCQNSSLSDNLNIVSEYDQEKTQSHTADNPMAPRGRVEKPELDAPSAKTLWTATCMLRVVDTLLYGENMLSDL